MSMVEIINGIQNTDPNVQFTCTQACRKLLSRERHPPIDDIIKAGVLPTLSKFLDFNDRYVVKNTLKNRNLACRSLKLFPF